MNFSFPTQRKRKGVPKWHPLEGNMVNSRFEIFVQFWADVENQLFYSGFIWKIMKF